jgi:lipoate-protein ligase B
VSNPAHKLSSPITVRELGLQDYEPLWRAMQRFTDTRTPETADEIWFTEHRPVFTLGLNASREHLLATGDIPVVQIDRGGQVTYHGPGMLMIYPLIDLKRLATPSSRAWDCASAAAPVITGWRSTSKSTWNRSCGSIPAVTLAWR